MNETNPKLLEMFMKYSDLLKELETETFTHKGNPANKWFIGYHVGEFIQEFQDFKNSELKKAALELEKDPGFAATEQLIDFYRSLWLKARDLEDAFKPKTPLD